MHNNYMTNHWKLLELYDDSTAKLTHSICWFAALVFVCMQLGETNKLFSGLTKHTLLV